jgi:peptide/nickel transport system substrate-binding protein
MRSRALITVLAALFAALALSLAACGGDDDDGGGGVSESDFPAQTAPPDDAKKGGTLTVIAAGDVDYMDPGAAYYQFTYMIDDAMCRKLLSWQPDDVDAPSPDLAAGEPTISPDGLTVTFKMKQGIKFAPPVNREITSQDIKYAIERGMLPGVATSYHGSYFGSLEGYEQALQRVEQVDTVAPDISGIQTPDDHTIVFKLTEPTAPTLIQVMGLPIDCPVPEEYAKEFDAETPSTYGEHVVASGPYMVENDDQGNLTGWSPGKEIIMVRNPNWDASTDFRPAFVDRIEVKEGFADTQTATERILKGDSQVTGDIIPEGPALKTAATQYPDQLVLFPSGGSRYIALNTTEPPFDDINVRKAVLAGADREALRLTRGGELAGPIANHFIMPLIPGFEDAGGNQGFGFDFLADPNGNPELSAEYFRKAGYQSGKYEGNEKVVVIGENTGIDKKQSQVAFDMLKEMGFNVELRQVSSDVMYTRFCNVPDSGYNVCSTVGWIKDFNDGQAIMDVPFYGPGISPTNNSNWPLLDNPAINKAIEKARLIDDIDARNKAWAEVDRMVTAQAPAIIFLWDNQADVRSENVNGVINSFNAVWDLSFTSLKNP